MKELDLEDVDFNEIKKRLLKEKEKYKRQEWAELLKNIGIKSSYFTNVIGSTNQKPSMRFLIKFSRILGKPLEYFLYGKNYFEGEEFGKKIFTVPKIDNYTNIDDSFIYLEKIAICSFPFDWLAKISEDPWDLVCITMHGDAMCPTIQPNSLLIIDTSKKTIVDNGIFAFNFKNLKHIQIRRLSFCVDKIAIISDNSKCCPYCHAEVSKLNILGRVICARSMLSEISDKILFVNNNLELIEKK